MGAQQKPIGERDGDFPRTGRKIPFLKWPTFASRRHPQPKIAPQSDLTLSSALSGTPVIAAMLKGLTPRGLVLRCYPFSCSYFILFWTQAPRFESRSHKPKSLRIDEIPRRKHTSSSPDPCHMCPPAALLLLAAGGVSRKPKRKTKFGENATGNNGRRRKFR